MPKRPPRRSGTPRPQPEGACVPRDGGAVRCPFCDSAATERVALFGSQLLVDQRRCGACQTYFEAVRDDR